MKWIVYGDWRYLHHEAAISSVLKPHGITVHPFRYRDFLSKGITGRIQNKLLVGPSIKRVNEAFVEFCLEVQPDVIFLRKPVALWGATITRVKECVSQTTIVTYNNDNPFDDGRRWTLWRHYYKVASKADINYFFRPSDLKAAVHRGWRKPKLLMPYYDPVLIEKGKRTPIRVSGAGFYGHYEPDGRDGFLDAVWEAGMDLTVIGPRWDELGDSSLAGRHAESRWLEADEYSRYLAGTAVCLCFLSKRNRDVYTRRVFEITAAGSVLLSERSDELKGLFEEDYEAVYFSSPQELVQKLKWLLANPEIASGIGRRGQERCLGEGHDVQARISKVIKEVVEHKAYLDKGQGR